MTDGFMRCLLVALTLSLMAGIWWLGLGPDCNQFGQGTLILCQLTRDGLVIGADKLIRYENEITHDNIKISQADKYTAVVSSGYCAMRNKQKLADGHFRYQNVFDASAVAVKFIQSVHPDGSIMPHLPLLCAELQREFNTGLARLHAHAPPAGNPIFQTLVFHYDSKAQKYEVAALRCHYRMVFPVAYSQVVPMPFPDSMLQSSWPLAFGKSEVVNELECGSDPRLEQARNTWMVKRYRLDRPPASQIGVSDASQLLQYLVEISNRCISYYDTEGAQISSSSDIALISPQHGFTWVHRGQ